MYEHVWLAKRNPVAAFYVRISVLSKLNKDSAKTPRTHCIPLNIVANFSTRLAVTSALSREAKAWKNSAT